MKISEVSQKYHLTEDTLRYYEGIGLLPKVSKKSNIRNYQEEDLKRIEFILCMKNSGLPLLQIKKFLDLYPLGKQSLLERIHILENQKEILESEIKEKEKSLEFLKYKINYLKNEEQK